MNSKNLVGMLPSNSPLRRPIVRELSKGMDVADASNLFSLSKKTIYNAINDKENILLGCKYKINAKRQRIGEEQVQIAMNFLNEKYPDVSGRNYRVIKLTKDCLYIHYYVYCNEINQVPLSKSYFCYSVLDKLNIHFSEDTTICCYCNDLKKLNSCMGPLAEQDYIEKEKLENHVARWHQQTLYFQKKKNEMVSNRNSNWVIIVQDFTQLQVQNTFYQDLIICLYYLDLKASDLLGRKYFHFVSPSSTVKNDCRFVFATWKKFIEKEQLDQIPFWFLFSDGGPKHFNLTATINFFGFLEKHAGNRS